MSKITITLPGLEPHEAVDMVRMAMHEWLSARGNGYVERRYADMDNAFRQERGVRLVRQKAALISGSVEVAQ